MYKKNQLNNSYTNTANMHHWCKSAYKQITLQATLVYLELPQLAT